MSKVITFSRFFPKGHPREGQPTYFVEKILNALYPDGFDAHFDDYIQQLNPLLPDDILEAFKEQLSEDVTDLKVHTLRSGIRWKAGDLFSPRVWSGKPYSSKQIIFAPDQKIIRVAKAEIAGRGYMYIDGKYLGHIGHKDIGELAHNDGLDRDDFQNWIKTGFSGQMIVFHNKELSY